MVLAIVLALVVAACGGSSDDGSRRRQRRRGETKTLTIGVLMPFSGDGALWGRTELASTEVAAEHVNAAGGIKVGNDTYKLAVKAYDNQWDPAVSATVARKAVADGVRYVLSWSGPEVLAENAATRGTTVLTFVTASDEMCQGPDHPNNYNCWFYFPDNMGVLYTYIHEAHPEYKTVAMVATDDAVSIQEAKDLKEQIEPIGFEVLEPVKISGDETDFYPVLTPLVNKGVDVIDIAPMGPEDAALLIKQARELGYKGIFAHADAPNIDEYADVAGWDALEGFVGCSRVPRAHRGGQGLAEGLHGQDRRRHVDRTDRRLRQRPAAGGGDREGRDGRPGRREQGPADGDRRRHHRRDAVRRRGRPGHPAPARAAHPGRRGPERQAGVRLQRLAAAARGEPSPSPSE